MDGGIFDGFELLLLNVLLCYFGSFSFQTASDFFKKIIHFAKFKDIVEKLLAFSGNLFSFHIPEHSMKKLFYQYGIC
jgi:hypothetical protein